MQHTQNPELCHILESIRIVMVNTTLPANIGSVARAMHTMGLSQLILVKPKKPIDDDAYAHATGGQHILDNIQVVATLQEAIADCQYIFATSSRQRHIPKPVLSPRQSANLIIQNALTQRQHHLALPKVAFVFGREDRGLTNDELRLADYHVQIPANSNYSVLNVAMAVQVITSILYEEIELATNKVDITTTKPYIHLQIRQIWDKPPITQSQKNQLEQQILDLLQKINLYSPEQAKHLPERVNRLLGRLQLDISEYQLLQAMLAKLG